MEEMMYRRKQNPMKELRCIERSSTGNHDNDMLNVCRDRKQKSNNKSYSSTDHFDDFSV